MATNKTSHLISSALQLGLKAKAIRLIDVLPGDQSAAITCRFQNHTLQDSTTYTALSYTWGGSNNTKEILPDGEASKVQDNLWRFLRHIREQDRCELFWIVAICIDQENFNQGKHQVALMKTFNPRYWLTLHVPIWEVLNRLPWRPLECRSGWVLHPPIAI